MADVRPIDANRLKENLKDHYMPTDQECETDRQWAVGYNAGIDRALFSIACAPVINPDNLMLHGRWIISSDGYYPYCSKCGEEPKHGEMTKYCPSCGTKMGDE